MNPAVLHLFAGAGGGALGFHRAGFRSVGAFDVDPVACATLEHLTGERAAARRRGGGAVRAQRTRAVEVTP